MENSKGGGQAEAGAPYMKEAFTEAIWEQMWAFLGCTTGDCPHHDQAQCKVAVQAIAKEMTEEWFRGPAPAPSEPLEASLGVDADLPDFNTVTQCNVVAGAWDFFQRMKAEFPGTAKAASAETYLRRTFATLKADIASLPRRAAPPKAASAVGEPRLSVIEAAARLAKVINGNPQVTGEGERTEA